MIDRGTEGAGASFRVWETRTTFPGLGLSNVVLSSRLGEPRRLHSGGCGALRSTRATVHNLRIMGRNIGRAVAQCVSAIKANTIFITAENAEEKPSPPGCTAWGRGRLLLWVSISCTGARARLGLVDWRLWFLKGKNILGVELRGNVNRLRHGGPA